MTFGEILKTAGIDTLLGMGTVFLLLIFMSVLISCFRFIPWLRPKEENAEADENKGTTGAVTPEAAGAAGAENGGDPNVLIAVITAAVMAQIAEEHKQEQEKQDGEYIVRSVRRAKWKHTLSE